MKERYIFKLGTYGLICIYSVYCIPLHIDIMFFVVTVFRRTIKYFYGWVFYPDIFLITDKSRNISIENPRNNFSLQLEFTCCTWCRLKAWAPASRLRRAPCSPTGPTKPSNPRRNQGDNVVNK